MDWPSQCAVVVPCLNEAAAIGSLVREIQRYLPIVIVIDDGSSDETGKLAARAGAEVLRHARAQGKGVALSSGWRRAHERGLLWALTMDGDGQHSPDDIPTFLDCAATGQAALIVGDRMGNAGGMPWVRRQVNRWMSWRLSRLAGCDLPDTQCGFRMMNLGAWSNLKLQTSHFEIESELLLAFAAARHRIEFVPIRVIYQDEESKIRPLKDTWRWFRWLLSRRA